MQLAHNVYFTLQDRSEAAADRLVAACKKYLGRQKGVVSFAVGKLARDLDRPVNDRDWDVGLHMVFATAKDQDDYQTEAMHKQFIEENKSSWEKVRVFDTLLD